ncbi:HupE/UreJ family protein [Actinoplanes derwentensis]|uniref:Hydrogenase/urease accessory protein HupE n=1 Tax=Actinoplanes derwentensis TaxID=113562 RepID=A0A1H1SRV5_9ACTN|nr:HupE/UreJ family protein [Actinoplanes derwentensis]GID83225.1 membrane protein [Actinoplanes derwentensis]SDS50740.1 Hydrogenase/urease accessory protein HupE [Actinoplanes derwentensis]
MSSLHRLLVPLAAAVLIGIGAGPAAAHGFISTVYADVTAAGQGHVRTVLELEYDLFVVSAADSGGNDGLFQDGTAAFEAGDPQAQAAALDTHATTAVGYVTSRFTVAAGGRACVPVPVEGFRMGTRENVPYTTLVLDWTCQAASDYELRSVLFPASEEFVRDTKTIVTYAIGGRTGSAALDAGTPGFSTAQPWYQRFAEFFVLGAEHLLFGLDHVLFLLALIAGSRRLREIVLAASAFTAAHSVTFILAALGLVTVPASIVEPIIALSIAVVAGWDLWQLRRETPATGRLAVVFLFGLVHGVGFAGALGIDEPFSWTLLWSLLVFNVGIETVQLALIAVTFPLLTLLRRRSPRTARWVSGVIAAGVSTMGLIWFVQRLTGS